MKLLKILSFALLVLLFVFVTPDGEVNADSGISIYLNDSKQSYGNQTTVINGATLVPLRGIFEGLGANVSWNASTKTIDASKGNTKVWLKIGLNTAKVNGDNVNISVPAQIVNGSTLVPLRFISETLGAKVEWVQATKTINISMNSGTPITPTSPVANVIIDPRYPSGQTTTSFNISYNLPLIIKDGYGGKVKFLSVESSNEGLVSADLNVMGGLFVGRTSNTRGTATVTLYYEDSEGGKGTYLFHYDYTQE